MKHIPSLDGFRGVAVLIVMCAHFNGLFGITSGTLGVDLFFVLSGFLITSLLINEIEETGTISLWQFYARRALRLLPALFAMVLLFGIIDLVFGIFNRTAIMQAMLAAALQYPSNWLRAYNSLGMYEFAHTWSLSIEEQFYLLWPVVLLGLFALRSKRAVLLILLTVILALQINRYAAVRHGTPLLYIGAATHMRIDAIFVGCLAAFARSNRFSVGIGAVPASVAALSIVAVILWRRTYFDWQQPIVVWSSAIIILHLADERASILQRAFSAEWLRYTGRISYGLYLYHYPLWLLTVHRYGSSLNLDTKHIIGLFVLAPVSFVIAAISYQYLEKPALAFKSRFRPRIAVAAE